MPSSRTGAIPDYKLRSIFAIDPGPEQSGWVTYRPDDLGVLESGVWPNQRLLAELPRDSVGARVAVEMIASYGMAVGREVFETCVWIGRFQQAAHSPGQVLRIERRLIKLHHCGSARAKDTNIWQALVDRFGPVGTKAAPGPLYGVKSHARAALALAVYVADNWKELTP